MTYGQKIVMPSSRAKLFQNQKSNLFSPKKYDGGTVMNQKKYFILPFLFLIISVLCFFVGCDAY